MYIKSNSWLALPRQGITINDKSILFYDDNPYSMPHGKQAERIVIKDFPLLEASHVILEYMVNVHNQVKPCSEMYFSKARNDDGSLTEFANGDRYFYAHSGFLPALPKQAMIGDYKCRL